MVEMILVTAAATPLGRAAASMLEEEGYALRRCDLLDLTDASAVASLVDGADAIVHLAPTALVGASPGVAGGDLLDLAARGTHVLYRAALAAGVTRAVQTSTLAVMDAYPEELEVTEQWRPRPRPEPAHLAPYLAELVAREFTRDPQLDAPLSIACLRLAAADALSLPDAASAIVRAAAQLRDGTRNRGHRFHLYHVADPSPTARYSSALAQRTLGYGGAR
jgi:nucleoside-diphosphate-sugar epimerase